LKNEKELYLYLENLKNKVFSHDGRKIKILEFGQRNFEEGPDFCRALVQIDDTRHRGAIELHLRAKDWYRHYHHINPLYDKVLLHLVWEDDVTVPTVFNNRGHLIPTLSIQKMKIRRKMLHSWICPHQKLLNSLDDLEYLGWQRTGQRIERFQVMIKKKGWEEALYHQLFRNLMYRKNIHLPVLVPLKELRKTGKEGVGEEREFAYFQRYHFMPPKISDEYSRRYRDYCLQRSSSEVINEHSLYGCRPYNYPLRRMAGLLILYDYFSYDFYGRIYSDWSRQNGKMEISQLIYHYYTQFDKHRTSYWHYHSSWGKTTTARVALIGKQRWKNILFNTLLPFLLIKARKSGHTDFAATIEKWIYSMPLMEQNYQERFIRSHLSFNPRKALHQYGLLLMYAGCFNHAQKDCSHCLEMLKSDRSSFIHQKNKRREGFFPF